MKYLIILLLTMGCIRKVPKEVLNTTKTGKEMEASKFSIASESSEAGKSVTFQGEKVELYKGQLKLGMDIFPLLSKLGNVDSLRNQALLISVVPSIDTPVCEAQTHDLGESKTIREDVKLVTISRDLPMAQSRFAREAKLENVTYFSDYKTGDFGKNSGLLMKGSELLARAVMVVDRFGIIRYLQVVPEITSLPDMKKAIEEANFVASEK